MKTSAKRILALLLALTLLTGVAAGAAAGPTRRPLTEAGRERVRDAVQTLRDMGEDTWADNVQLWLDDGKI